MATAVALFVMLVVLKEVSYAMRKTVRIRHVMDHMYCFIYRLLVAAIPLVPEWNNSDNGHDLDEKLRLSGKSGEVSNDRSSGDAADEKRGQFKEW